VVVFPADLAAVLLDRQLDFGEFLGLEATCRSEQEQNSGQTHGISDHVRIWSSSC
jgi:hypothetical protein